MRDHTDEYTVIYKGVTCTFLVTFEARTYDYPGSFSYELIRMEESLDEDHEPVGDLDIWYEENFTRLEEILGEFFSNKNGF